MSPGGGYRLLPGYSRGQDNAQIPGVLADLALDAAATAVM
jgi:hypothetical protein